MRLPEELDKKLVEAFPNLYAVRHTTRHRLRYGFSVGSGWYDLLWKLSEKIEAAIVAQPESERQEFVCVSVKQKLGGLRFQMSDTTQEMHDAIMAAEDTADHTCEVCASPSAQKIPIKRGSGSTWLFVLCGDDAARMERGEI